MHGAPAPRKLVAHEPFQHPCIEQKRIGGVSGVAADPGTRNGAVHEAITLVVPRVWAAQDTGVHVGRWTSMKLLA